MASSLKSKLPARLLKRYDPEIFFDEMVAADGAVRPHYARFRELFLSLTPHEFELKRQSVDLAFMRQGTIPSGYFHDALLRELRQEK